MQRVAKMRSSVLKYGKPSTLATSRESASALAESVWISTSLKKKRKKGNKLQYIYSGNHGHFLYRYFCFIYYHLPTGTYC